MKTIAIIPTLNEFQHLAGVIEETGRHVDHIVVVDDGSKRALLNGIPDNANVRVVRHRINLGKGAAMKTGVAVAQQLGAEAVIFLDADGQHDPSEIPSLLKPLKTDQADIVFGIRHFHGKMPFVARLGNIFLTRMLIWLYKIPIQDTQSGYRAFRVSSYPQLKWKSPRYAVETEMIVNAGKNHVRWAEAPIKTIYLDKYRGTTVLDGVRIFASMISWRFR